MLFFKSYFMIKSGDRYLGSNSYLIIIDQSYTVDAIDLISFSVYFIK